MARLSGTGNVASGEDCYQIQGMAPSSMKRKHGTSIASSGHWLMVRFLMDSTFVTVATIHFAAGLRIFFLVPQ